MVHPNSQEWIEVSLTVEGEIAEAVSETLSRYAPRAISLEWVPPSEEAAPQSSGDLVTVRAYLPAGEDQQARLRKLREALWHLGQIQPLPDPQIESLGKVDWGSTWRDHYKPIPVGERLIIVPAWLSVSDSDRKPIILEPGMAFGTGTHPTTQLCIELMEGHLHPGDVVLDVGCGSGILSIAAANLGAARVIGIEPDSDAIIVAQENIARNKAEGVEILHVSGEDFLLRTDLPPIDLLVANILANTLTDLVGRGIADLVVPGGRLIFSGILADQARDFTQAAEAAGLVLVELCGMKDWRGLVFTKATP